MDLGSCPKHHALALRADYEKALDRGKDYDYDIDAMEHLTNFIAGEIINYTEEPRSNVSPTEELRL